MQIRINVNIVLIHCAVGGPKIVPINSRLPSIQCTLDHDCQTFGIPVISPSESLMSTVGVFSMSMEGRSVRVHNFRGSSSSSHHWTVGSGWLVGWVGRGTTVTVFFFAVFRMTAMVIFTLVTICTFTNFPVLPRQ